MEIRKGYKVSGIMSERKAYLNMISRCSNPKHRNYRNYGGRGINVCDRWKKSFENFINDMGRRPLNVTGLRRDEYSIDRIDNNGNYCPENCKWATRAEQNRNTRTNKYITAGGETLTYAEWERKLGFKHGVIRDRLAGGWNPIKAVTIGYIRFKSTRDQLIFYRTPPSLQHVSNA